MIDIKIEERTECWECDDGCCSNYVEYYTVYFNDKIVLDDFEAASEADAVMFALKKEGIAKNDKHFFSLVGNEKEYKNL